MTNTKEKNTIQNERMLSFKLSQEFTEEALKAISGAYNYQAGDPTYACYYDFTTQRSECSSD